MTNGKNFILLAAGALISIIFFVFCAECYELFYYKNEFSNFMYNERIYRAIAAITIALPWAAAGVYYYLIDSVRFDRWFHWLIVALAVAIVTPVVCYFVTQEDLLDYNAESIELQIYNIVFSFIMFVIASFSIRYWSRNCRHTPIPQ